MPNLTSIGVTSGIPTSGTGVVSTIDALLRMQPTLGTPLGFSIITALSTAKGLHQGTLGAIPASALRAEVYVSGQAVMLRTDGTAPTSSVGMGPYQPGSLLLFYGAELAAVRLIEVVAGATLSVEFKG